MNFTQSVRTCFSKYVTFSGRAQRSEFWWFVLFVFVGGIVLVQIDIMLFGQIETGPGYYSGSTDFGLFSSIFSLACFLPTLSVQVRRLHDTGRSGWWWWIMLVPLVGIIVLIVFWATEGTRGPNRFGEDPIGGTGSGGGYLDDPSIARSNMPKVPRD